jgi:hypothetical protein
MYPHAAYMHVQRAMGYPACLPAGRMAMAAWKT